MEGLEAKRFKPQRGKFTLDVFVNRRLIVLIVSNPNGVNLHKYSSQAVKSA